LAWWHSLVNWWPSLTEAFRERRRKLLNPDGDAPRWTYDAYPDRRTPAEFRLVWQARGPDGRFLVEEVDLVNYDFDKTPWQLKEPEQCAVFVGEVLAANTRLKRRRDALRVRATRPRGGLKK
jgi:hypothetical protein